MARRLGGLQVVMLEGVGHEGDFAGRELLGASGRPPGGDGCGDLASDPHRFVRGKLQIGDHRACCFLFSGSGLA